MEHCYDSKEWKKLPGWSQLYWALWEKQHEELGQDFLTLDDRISVLALTPGLWLPHYLNVYEKLSKLEHDGRLLVVEDSDNRTGHYVVR